MPPTFFCAVIEAGRTILRTSAARAHLDAYLEDYAYLTEGLLDLYEAGSAESYLQAAARLAGYLISDFMDHEQGGFFTTAKQHESLIVRHREGTDGATPSANAVAASALARLSFHFDREDWRRAAVAATRAYGRQMARYPSAFAKSLAVIDFLTEGPVELAFVGDESQDDVRSLRESVARHYLPNRIVATGSPEHPSSLPLLQGRPAVSGKPTLYICRHYTCRQPITDPRSVEEALQADQAHRPSWSRTKTAARHQPLGKRNGPGYGGLCLPSDGAGRRGRCTGFYRAWCDGLDHDQVRVRHLSRRYAES